MALTALNMAATFELASKSDPAYDEDIAIAKEKGATIFTCGYLPKEVCAELSDDSQSATQRMNNGIETTYHAKNSRKAWKAFRRGLRNVQNFPDENDVEQVFQSENIVMGIGKATKVAAIAYVDKFPMSVINEIGSEILKRSSLTDDERKKSDGLFTLLTGTETSSAASAMTSKKSSEGAQSQLSGMKAETPMENTKDTG